MTRDRRRASFYFKHFSLIVGFISIVAKLLIVGFLIFLGVVFTMACRSISISNTRNLFDYFASSNR